MGVESKKIIEKTKEVFKVVQTESDLHKKTISTMDKELSKKIENVEKAAKEVVDHIERRNDGG